MKDYMNGEPVFSKSIRIVEPTDPAHADNVNAAPIQLLQNTLANRNEIEALRAGMNAIYGILCGYQYDKTNKKITSFLQHDHTDGILTFPEGAAYRDGDKIILAGAAAGVPQIPGYENGGGTAGNVDEIAADAAKMVKENMAEIDAGQVRDLFGIDK